MTKILNLCFLFAVSGAQAFGVAPIQGYEVGSHKITDYADIDLPVSCAQPSCQLKAHIANGRFRIDGKVEKLQMLHRSGSKVSPQQVAREYTASLTKVGGKLLNRESGENGAFVFKVPDGAGHVWVVLDDNFAGYHTLYLVTPQTRASTVSVQASELAASLRSDGLATLYINFDTGRSELKAAVEPTIDETVTLLKQQPTLRVSVEGHTDNQGDAAANRQLSLDRARAIVAALEARGIAKGRLAAKGHGQDAPIADNRKEDGRAKNRRVELVQLT
ncbi:OmpA family protein [Roseateles sp. DC23W]|uniref:OmpA family protein n=1 Tax=Pelomonas dachongensis TaxID=3299029 RepID=A0ABW7EGL1_9BURK